MFRFLMQRYYYDANSMFAMQNNLVFVVAVARLGLIKHDNYNQRNDNTNLQDTTHLNIFFRQFRCRFCNV